MVALAHIAFRDGCHHDLEVQPDGRIYLLTRKISRYSDFRRGAPFLEDFITVLERKAIDRYLERRGVDRATRRRLLDPHGAPDFGLKGDHWHDRKAFRKKRKHKGLPPGLAKRNRLPPGLAKRSDLPPGLAKRDLPDDLAYLLPKRAKGRRLYEINGNIVLVDLATDIVLDVIEGVLFGDTTSF